MVLAIIGIMAGLLAGNAGAFIETAKEEPPNRILRKAVLDATYLASQEKELVYLRYDDTNGTLLIEDSTGSQLASHRIVEIPDEHDFEPKEREFSLIFEADVPLAGIDGDEGDWEEDQIYLRRVVFHPSGVSTPFIARLRTGLGENKEKTFRFDPFSGYPRRALGDER
ncbi:MAG: hypothetical protein CMI31_03230 [Opitutae bacterium]|nr:hypothetical protein [Opitutae bacterium]